MQARPEESEHPLSARTTSAKVGTHARSQGGDGNHYAHDERAAQQTAERALRQPSAESRAQAGTAINRPPDLINLTPGPRCSYPRRLSQENIMKRAAKIIGILILILLVVAIALPFLVNVNRLRPTIESQASSALGRKVTIGNLKLSILTGSVSADDLSIADDPAFGKAPFVTAKALNVGVELMPLVLNKTLHVTDLTLDRPQIALLRTPAGKWNFSSLGGSNASPARDKAPASADPKGNTTDQSLENLSVAKLNVNNGRVSIGDANGKSKPHVYDNVNVTVRNFSFSSQFPLTVTVDLPGGGNLKLDGKAGPINQNDAVQTPLEAKLDVKRLDLAASGFVDPSSGIAGLADFDGTVASDGRVLRSNGTMKADKLKMSAKGSPAGRPVEVRYATDYNLQSQSGTLSRSEEHTSELQSHSDLVCRLL